MANSYFQFKEFRINQEDCAMKVSTEACILGACVTYSNPNRILDIGAGTGLLSLMLAQKYTCEIDAVEMESNAAAQAKQNFLNSPWSKRLNIIHKDIQNFNTVDSEKYDLIICNPPFFKKGLKSTNKEKNLAKHDDSLPKTVLAQSIKALLTKEGVAFVLLPEDEANILKKVADEINLDFKDYFIVKNRPETKVFRKVIVLGNVSQVKTQELIIRDDKNEYSELFKKLLKPYYLNL